MFKKAAEPFLPTKTHLTVEILAASISKVYHFAYPLFDDPTVYVFLIHLSHQSEHPIKDIALENMRVGGWGESRSKIALPETLVV